MFHCSRVWESEHLRRSISHCCRQLLVLNIFQRNMCPLIRTECQQTEIEWVKLWAGCWLYQQLNWCKCSNFHRLNTFRNWNSSWRWEWKENWKLELSFHLWKWCCEMIADYFSRILIATAMASFCCSIKFRCDSKVYKLLRPWTSWWLAASRILTRSWRTSWTLP